MYDCCLKFAKCTAACAGAATQPAATLLYLAAQRLLHTTIWLPSSKLGLNSRASKPSTQTQLALQAADRIVFAAVMVAVLSLVPLLVLKYSQV